MNANQWNERYPVGTNVVAYPGVRPDEYPKAKARSLVTRTRSEASVLGGHTDVVWVEGHAACIALSHVDLSCEQCGRSGTRGFQVLPATEHTKPITICASRSACRKRWPRTVLEDAS